MTMRERWRAKSTGLEQMPDQANYMVDAFPSELEDPAGP